MVARPYEEAEVQRQRAAPSPADLHLDSHVRRMLAQHQSHPVRYIPHVGSEQLLFATMHKTSNLEAIDYIRLVEASCWETFLSVHVSLLPLSQMSEVRLLCSSLHLIARLFRSGSTSPCGSTAKSQ